MGLVSDFFLQMLFFTTVLSIDIRRMEVGVAELHPSHHPGTLWVRGVQTPGRGSAFTQAASGQHSGLTIAPQLADLNKRLPPEACLPPAKPGGRPARQERQLAVRPSTPHTITLQPSSFRNLRLPKRLRVIYFLARTRLAQRLIMVPACPALWGASTRFPWSVALCLEGEGCFSGPSGPLKPGLGNCPLCPPCPDPGGF